MNARQVAEARRLLDNATAEHQAAAEKAQSIRNRIAASTLRQSEITANRINGISTPAEAAEYAALAGDVEALKAMLAVAETDSTVKLAGHHTAKDDLAVVEQAHATEQTQLAFDALKARAEMLESAFCGCVAELHKHGQKLGLVSLVMSYRPTQKLLNIAQGVRL